MESNSVIIFRKHLLPYTETFIVDQNRFLSRYSPYFAGFEENETGVGMLDEFPKFVLQNYEEFTGFRKLNYHLGIFNKAWYADIKGVSPGLVHAHFLKDGIMAHYLCRKLGVPLITTLHGSDITIPEKKRFLKLGRRQFFDKAEKIIVISDYIASKAIENGCDENKIVKHAIGIDLDKFTYEKAESPEPEILFVGRLMEVKGPTYLLEATKQLSRKYDNLKVTFVGDGPLKSTLENMAASYDLNVEFAGIEPPPSVRDRLSRTWMLVAPSITGKKGNAEGLGMVFLEAQAMHTPVVSFKCGGIPDAVKDGETGLLADEKDIDGLAQRMDYLIQNEPERRRLGSNGRARVEKYFDIKKQTRVLEEIYDSVC